MYQMDDQSWSSIPFVMSSKVLAAAARRIGEHASNHDLDKVEVVLHGGEPLLAGADVLADVATTIRRALPRRTVLDVNVQTNGVLLDAPLLDVFARHGISVGVSLDGDPETHDRHRRYANGKGSYAQTARALELLQRTEYRDLYRGVCCVIDVRSDPVRTYESLLAFAPPVVNFLLPHGNWTTPPPLRDADSPNTPYGDWLVTAFDRWYRSATRETEVRIFTEIVNLVLGGDTPSESVGLSPAALVTVNTDGSMEQVDSLRSSYDGAVQTGYNVTDHSFDDVLGHPAVVARQMGAAALSDTCRTCDIHRICGGGYYPHRYRRGHGFRNPSVYCHDLTRLIKHVQQCVAADMAALLPDATLDQVDPPDRRSRRHAIW